MSRSESCNFANIDRMVMQLGGWLDVANRMEMTRDSVYRMRKGSKGERRFLSARLAALLAGQCRSENTLAGGSGAAMSGPTLD